jgi:hypothetical protein
VPTIQQITALFRAFRHGWDLMYLEGTDVVLIRAGFRIAIDLAGNVRRYR